MNRFACLDILIRLYQPRRWRPPEIFVMDVIHHAKEVEGRIAAICFLNISNPARNSIDRFIGQFFSKRANTGRENSNQAPANLFVEKSRAFAIRIKPGEQPIEILLPEFPEFSRG